jgi:endonuclease G
VYSFADFSTLVVPGLNRDPGIEFFRYLGLLFFMVVTMKTRVLFILLAILAVAVLVLIIQLSAPEQIAIASCDDQGDRESKHFLFGMPQWNDGKESDQIIPRSIYDMSFNFDTKLADWVGYCLDKYRIDGTNSFSGHYPPDHEISEKHQLSHVEYDCAQGEIGADRGHLAPRASFDKHEDWMQVNYISNIAPQNAYLNQGIWAVLEEKIREAVRAGRIVFVVTGPYFSSGDAESTLKLPRTALNKEYRIPSGFWKIIAIQDPSGHGNVNAIAFIFENHLPQVDGLLDMNYPWSVKLADHVVSIDDIEEITNLDFFPKFELKKQDKLENEIYGGYFLHDLNHNINPPDLKFNECQNPTP